MRLYYIGNGFDVAHGLPTEYSDFRNYLFDTYNVKDKWVDTLPDYYFDRDGERRYNEKEVIEFICNYFNEHDYWYLFEDSLGCLNFNMFIEEEPSIDDDHYGRAESIVSDIASVFSEVIPKIGDLFKEWISTIDISTTNKIFNLKQSDLYLSFNYTKVLEKVYGIFAENVCHIHGEQGDEIIYGHYQDRDFELELSFPTMADITLQDLHDSLRKPVNQQYSNHIDFFNKIYNSNVTEIYNIGNSLCASDIYYLERIIENIDSSNITYYFSKHTQEYKKDDIPIIKSKLLKRGFKGKFAFGDI